MEASGLADGGRGQVDRVVVVAWQGRREYEGWVSETVKERLRV